MVDAQGNEIPIPPEEAAGVAPPHPDVEGAEPETVGVPEQAAKAAPNAQANVKAGESKEDEAGKSKKEARDAKPASEGNEATAA